MFSETNLNSFLKVGYFLDYKNPTYSFDFSKVDKENYKSHREIELIEIGSKILLEAITSRFDGTKKHVVPLSGGLDSRAILAGLLECTEAKNIHTYTFGTPGTLDYDIGNEIAKKFSTNHIQFPLTEYKYEMDELVDIAKRVDFQTVLFHHPPIWRIDEIFSDHIIWSGFMGGELSGGHLSIKQFYDFDAVKLNYLSKNTYVKSIKLYNSKEIDFFPLIKIPEPHNPNITIQEQLDFNNRQLKYVAPHVLMKGFTYKTPFLDREWSTFILSVDNQLRYNQRLYKKILLKVFSKAFSYKTKTNFGLPIDANNAYVFAKRAQAKVKRIINNVYPIFINNGINYIDFDDGIRERPDLNKIVYENIMDLQKRNMVDWINIEKIWDDHINKRGNFADALIVLTSLEIHLKNKKERV